MKKYQAYKDSGISWIGEIPVDWSIKKLKYYTTTNDEVLTESTTPNYEFRYVDIGSVTLQNGIEQYQSFSFENAPSRARRIVRAGDVIVSTVRTYLKAVASIHDDKDVIVSTGFAVIRPKEVDSRFLAYSLANHYFVEMVSSRSTGVSYPAINASAMVNIKNVLPPNDIQKCIADYLDRKTEAVDTAISDKEKLIQLLEEQRTSVICSAVIKGIDSTAEMKDSGVEWLGEIPAHWQVLTNHQLFAERNIKCTEPDAVLLSVTKHLGVILQSQVEELNLATVAPAETTEGYKVVRKGDLVMNIMRAKDGSYGISGYNGVISPAYCIYYPRQKVNPQYLYYLFKTPMYMEIFKNYSTGIAEHRMRLYPVNFFKIPAVVPPLEEQNEIVAYLDKRVKDIDELISLTQQQIEKLKEYRQSVISEVVTGKVAVI